MTPTAVASLVRCLRASRFLQRYVDGETDERTARRVAAHLRECRRCGREAGTYRAIKRAVRSGRSADDLALRRLRSFHRNLATGRSER